MQESMLGVFAHPLMSVLLILFLHNANSMMNYTKTDLKGQGLTAVPTHASVIPTDTTDLDLSTNNLSEIPDLDLTEITTLNLTYNLFIAMPNLTSISGSLSYLCLEHNEISTLDDGNDFIFTNLIHLHVCHNKLRSIRRQLFERTPKLFLLTACSNRIRDFPDLTPISTKITTLDLSYNHISYIDPEQLNKLVALTTFKITSNRLSAFPDVAGPADTLTTLTMSVAATSTFPRLSLISKSLEKLTLRRSPLQTLPDLSDVIDTLTFLDLTKTEITKWPAERFSILHRLSELRLDVSMTETLPPICSPVPDMKIKLRSSSSNIANLCDCRNLWLKAAQLNGTTFDVDATCTEEDHWSVMSMQQMQKACTTNEQAGKFDTLRNP